ncbi:DUF4835 family protein [Flavobacterium sp. TMP13]|uniref:type IX secretion system protein PorD n=1 Tax=unclassified Flavobacterium TaxID=196869 RepID=UPI00076CDA09|nr:DUF4835 family protein [Flavobacterium sp. TAB 87]KVV15833.1 hypothetical protein AP058_00673 [Flavobacterium sp. TAB 87]
MNKFIAVLAFFCLGIANAQQLNCTVTINTQMLSNTNQQVYKTLETSIADFVNNTDWTGAALKQHEKISCSMYITLASQNSDQYSGTIQIQSSRLVYNSTYSSPIFNFNDKDFNFNYSEFQNLLFNPTTYDGNLVSVLSFYSYIILGMDADSFAPLGGNRYFEIAQNIANVAQQGSYKGWTQADGTQNRYYLINDMLASMYNELRQTSYAYNTALDLMTQDQKVAKEKIVTAILNIKKINSVKPNAFLTRVFFDAKSDEIVSIFSGGPTIPITDLVDTLNRVSPLNATKWSEIKF